MEKSINYLFLELHEKLDNWYYGLQWNQLFELHNVKGKDEDEKADNYKEIENEYKELWLDSSIDRKLEAYNKFN